MSHSRHHSLTSPGSAKSVWGSLHDQHPFPEAVSLLQLIKGVFIVVHLPRSPTSRNTPGGPVRSFCAQGSYSVLPRSLSKETQFFPVSSVSLIRGILLFCLRFR